MKKQIKNSLYLCLVAMLVAVSAYAGKYKKTVFAVSGNCGMCEMRIEKSLKDVKGVKLGDWDKTTKKITVKYDPTVITLKAIQQKIADAGYDNAGARAKDKVYAKLPGCCKYDRKEAKAASCCSSKEKKSCSKEAKEAGCAEDKRPSAGSCCSSKKAE